ncbi:HAD family hydrolase [Motiliproteus sp. SC1-56]|uniref:KdsC family phosphatase n=1 Tax=Motiliproteus sp. SC1-56 TaxID=2799565 RepID=UPI001A8D10A6|nr:HAD family hydrolase [Motiliproteus sp. SC1-56]
MQMPIEERARQIRLLALDVDGVLTDGRLYYSHDGERLKVFNTLDGHGIKLLQASGVEVAVITGRSSDAMARRIRDLGIAHLYAGREDKLTALNELWSLSGHTPETTAYMGDDWPDLPAMLACRLAATVPNAADAVLEKAHWCARKEGGLGAVRELCELIMSAQGTLAQALAPYLSTHHESL